MVYRIVGLNEHRMVEELETFNSSWKEENV